MTRMASRLDAAAPSGRVGRRRRSVAAAALLGAAAVAVAAVAWRAWAEEPLPPMPATAEEAFEQLPEPSEEDGWRRELPDPLPKPDLVLTDQHGDAYDLREETAGRATLLFFGYTHCPDACPAQMAILAAALDDLGAQARERLEVVFVTVDPARDSPERLREWLARFDQDVVGLTGDLDAVAEAMGELHLAEPVAEEGGDDGAYEVHHHTPFVAFHPADDRARTMYPFGMRQEHWREELPRLVDGEPLSGG